MVNLAITKVVKPKVIPCEDSLGFGRYFSDHMFVMDYQAGKDWHNPRIVPYGEVALFPSTMALHYGQAIFEGMKAFRNKQNEIVIFRTRDHLTRLNRSAHIMSIPAIDTEAVYEFLHALIAMEKHWVPGKMGTSLYIRPFIIAADPCVGVKVSDTYRLFIILSPSGV
ncbi:aminotransferase class IV [Sporomusa acidovorans]|uniref:Branched-chain-amino-acid transaminase 1 n=1 Tax=Sporomusa acidovorans (strain ATCC 49682 / DSM 3132 / Mol) TaxID=1123286 RepID=A0ABZ3J6Y4_SPOA4|nr:branched-chain-amino-acid transaminase 1 [Sporomusa acidovorans DSM 3132]SDE36987.1 branched-chain amino acid aminotransferase [Sporomusa acidovorans]